MTPFAGGPKRKKWWAAIAGSIGFCLVGLAFVPGLISRQPTLAPTPTPEQAPIVAPGYEPSPTPTPAKP